MCVLEHKWSIVSPFSICQKTIKFKLKKRKRKQCVVSLLTRHVDVMLRRRGAAGDSLLPLCWSLALSPNHSLTHPALHSAVGSDGRSPGAPRLRLPARFHFPVGEFPSPNIYITTLKPGKGAFQAADRPNCPRRADQDVSAHFTE